MAAAAHLNLTEMYNKVNATTKRVKKKLPFVSHYCQTTDFKFHYTVQTLAGERE